jgi:hypothetical protein
MLLDTYLYKIENYQKSNKEEIHKFNLCDNRSWMSIRIRIRNTGTYNSRREG